MPGGVETATASLGAGGAPAAPAETDGGRVCAATASGGTGAHLVLSHLGLLSYRSRNENGSLTALNPSSLIRYTTLAKSCAVASRPPQSPSTIVAPQSKPNQLRPIR